MRLLSAHFHYTAGLPHQLVTSLVWQGQPGVQIFFAVSGFLITTTTIKRWGALEKVRPQGFYLIRFARIAPLLLTLLALLSLLHAIHMKNFIVSEEQGGLGNALFAALTLHVGFLEASRGYLPANWDILWSLSVEEMFYLFFPLACWLLGRGRGLVLLLCAFVVLGPFARTTLAHGNEVWKEYSYLGGMDAIALGCLTAVLIAHRPLSRWLTRALAAIGLTLLVFCLCFEDQVVRFGLEKTGLGMSILAIGACMLIAATVESKWRAPRIFNPLLAFGRRSYEIYLTHMFVVFAFFDLFVLDGRPMRMIPVLFLVSIVVSGMLGEVVARYYSEPANRWLRARFGHGAKILGSVIEGN